MFTDYDIRAAAVALAARGEAIGAKPLPVILTQGMTEEEGWRRVAIDYLTEVAKARHEGRIPPGINTYDLRTPEGYAAMEDQ